MSVQTFGCFFRGEAGEWLRRGIRMALDEDGADLTGRALFHPEHMSEAVLWAKQDTLVVGLPLIPLVLEEAERNEPGFWSWEALAEEGVAVKGMTPVARLEGSSRIMLKAERVLLNFIMRLSGIANLTALYVQKLEGTGVRLLDTRKTAPGLRYPDKYAVLAGGGRNHRFGLEDMLMLKDNHIDAAGSIGLAVAMLRRAYASCPPIEVECRRLEEVRQAVAARVERIMLDNMDMAALAEAVRLVPPEIETEISGGVSLENIGMLAGLKPRAPDFISVGRLTHSAPSADFSLRFVERNHG